MNSLTTGSLIVLFVLVSQFFAAYIQSQTVEEVGIGECTLQVIDNQTQCQPVEGDSFLETVLEVSISGIDGAPEAFNIVWVAINLFLLSMGIVLILGWFVGLFFGGAS